MAKPEGIPFSWNNPKADCETRGAVFDKYQGPKLYHVGRDGVLRTREQMLAAYKQTGSCQSTSVYRVMQGEPEFEGLMGPTWGGVWDGKPIIRYDTWEDYDSMSR